MVGLPVGWGRLVVWFAVGWLQLESSRASWKQRRSAQPPAAGPLTHQPLPADNPTAVLGLMQVYGQAAKPPMLALLPALSAVASHRGPELASLPKVAASRGGGVSGADEGGAGTVKPEFAAAYSDLRTAQVGGGCCCWFGGRPEAAGRPFGPQRQQRWQQQ